MLKLLSFAVFAAFLAFSASSFAADATTTELADGTKVEIDGNNVFVIGADGSKTPAPDGEHKTKDGQTLITKDGVLQK